MPDSIGGLGVRYSQRISCNGSNIARIHLMKGGSLTICWCRLRAGELKELYRTENIQPENLKRVFREQSGIETGRPIIYNAPKFELGHVVATPAVVDSVDREELIKCFHLHSSGNWGIVCNDDAEANNAALKDGSRILSAYMVSGQKIWIITEAEDENGRRNATTALFPCEY